MHNKSFDYLIYRIFPRKKINYLKKQVQFILEKDSKCFFLNSEEKDILTTYQAALLNKHVYYDKANLDFIRVLYPLTLKQQVSKETQSLYSDILRLSSKNITNRLGQELLFNKIAKKKS